ncbi:PREDICTED: uncharacterized protein LOC106820843 [Priapulus caudatus]|uniref:Uncharacterized protein LOC106820843 n=1 Tax=Priapulus caudatus TaxID=37621 RepID=A0ABM1F8Z7_PRICU|nr:PREDICTED: uncharacterized protein LOC106820843 [Priapulus caudatus]
MTACAVLQHEQLTQEIQQYGECLLEEAAKLLTKQKLVDGSVQTAGGTYSFTCHRLLLATCNPRLTDQVLLKRSLPSYTLNVRSQYILNVFKCYLYTGTIHLHEADVTATIDEMDDKFLFPEIKQAFEVFTTILAKNMNKSKFLVKGKGLWDLTAYVEVTSKEPLVCKFDIRKMRIRIMLSLLGKLYYRSQSHTHHEQFDILVGSSDSTSKKSVMFGAHKLVLAIACSKITPLLLQNNNVPAIKFGGVVTERAISATLKSVYTSVTDLEQKHDAGRMVDKKLCWEVMKSAQTFGMASLERTCHALLQAGSELKAPVSSKVAVPTQLVQVKTEPKDAVPPPASTQSAQPATAAPDTNANGAEEGGSASPPPAPQSRGDSDADEPATRYGYRLLARLNAMRVAEQLTDAFIVGRGGARCMVTVHKLMLAVTSTYTRSHLDRSLCSNTFVFSCHKEILLALARFLYTGVIELNETLLGLSDKVVQAFHVEDFSRVVDIFRRLVALKEVMPGGGEAAWRAILAAESRRLDGDIRLLSAEPLSCRFDVRLQRLRSTFLGLKYIYAQMMYTDVKVVGCGAGEAQVRTAHRVVVAAAMPDCVRSVLVSDSSVDTVCFDDVSDAVVEVILRFIYSGKLTLPEGSQVDADMLACIHKVAISIELPELADIAQQLLEPLHKGDLSEQAYRVTCSVMKADAKVCNILQETSSSLMVLRVKIHYDQPVIVSVSADKKGATEAMLAATDVASTQTTCAPGVEETEQTPLAIFKQQAKKFLWHSGRSSCLANDMAKINIFIRQTWRDLTYQQKRIYSVSGKIDFDEIFSLEKVAEFKDFYSEDEHEAKRQRPGRLAMAGKQTARKESSSRARRVGNSDPRSIRGKTSRSHSLALLDALAAMAEADELTDTRVHSCHLKRVHRVVIASGSHLLMRKVALLGATAQSYKFDYSEPVVAAICRYLYSGMLAVSEEVADELKAFAEEYDLREVCDAMFVFGKLREIARSGGDPDDAVETIFKRSFYGKVKVGRGGDGSGLECVFLMREQRASEMVETLKTMYQKRLFTDLEVSGGRESAPVYEVHACVLYAVARGTAFARDIRIAHLRAHLERHRPAPHYPALLYPAELAATFSRAKPLRSWPATKGRLTDLRPAINCLQGAGSSLAYGYLMCEYCLTTGFADIEQLFRHFGRPVDGHSPITQYRHTRMLKCASCGVKIRLMNIDIKEHVINHHCVAPLTILSHREVDDHLCNVCGHVFVNLRFHMADAHDVYL